MPPALNKNHAGVKRIMQEARELAADTSSEYTAAPLEDDIFEWHGTLRGPAGTDYEGGLYHFRILLPAEYPFRPPAIQLLTPNGRFDLNTNICISFTNYHEESWQPAWGLRSAIIALSSFFPMNGKDAVGVGGIEYPPSERKRLAKSSRGWRCDKCAKTNVEDLPDPESTPISNDLPIRSTSQDEEPTPVPTDASAIVHEAAAEAIPVTLVSIEGQPQSPIPEPARSTSSSLDTIAPPTSISPRVPASAPASLNAAVVSMKALRPPVLLDTAICVLVVLVAALLYRRIL